MKKSILLAAAFLVLAPAAASAEEQPMSVEMMSEARAAFDEMMTRLKLTEVQKTTVVPILVTDAKARYKVWTAWRKDIGVGRPKPQELGVLGEKMSRVQGRTRSDLLDVLSDEQIAEWDLIQKERAEAGVVAIMNDNSMWGEIQ